MTRAGLLLLLVLAAGCAAPFEGTPRYVPPVLRHESSLTVMMDHEPRLLEDEPLSLERCIRLAFASNRGLRIADRRALMAEDRVDELWATVTPRLSASGQWSARDSIPESSFGDSTVEVGDQRVFSGKVSLLVPLLTFGRASNALEAAEHGVEAYRAQGQRARQELILAVERSYYQALEARWLIGVLQDSIRVLDKQLSSAREFLAQGLVARNDVLAIELRLAERRQQGLRAEHARALALATLNRLMGMDVSRPTRLMDVADVAKPWSGTLYDVMALALDERPDLQALDLQIQAAQASYRSTRANLLPGLYVFGDYTHTSDDHLAHQDWVTGGIGVEIPLFDGGITLAQMDRQQREIEELIDVYDDRVDDLMLEVNAAYLELIAAGEELAIGRLRVQLAQDTLAIVQDQYGQGLQSGTEVLIGEEGLAAARVELTRGLARYHIALAHLANICGVPVARLNSMMGRSNP